MKTKKRVPLFHRVLSFILALAMMVTLMPSMAFAEGTGTTLYLKPNENWQKDNARFAAYFFKDGGETWVDMTDADSDGYYEVTAPDGYSSVIFCRMNPGTTENNWNNKWNQSADLNVPTDDNNCYTVAEGAWDNGNGTWSVYTPTSGEPDPTPTATYIIAGDSATLFGEAWAPSNTANQMTLNGDGLYEKVYSDVAAGTYKFKVTDGSWNNCWGGTGENADTDGNYVLSLSEESNVTITFNADTKAIAVNVVPAENEPDPTPTVDYYLVGYINNADYDGTDYKFENNTLTVTFTANSYVAVKSSTNTNWYMTDGWLGETATSATLSDSSTLTSANKLYVPGNVEVTFTLTENSDGSLTLSYTQAGSGDEGDGEETSYTVTIHYHNTDNWAEVAAYVWNADDEHPMGD